jgi:Na+/proline symporter
MNVTAWTFIMVISSFIIYITIAIWSRARTTGEFYIAGSSVHPVVNGMATAADWMSAYVSPVVPEKPMNFLYKFSRVILLFIYENLVELII